MDGLTLARSVAEIQCLAGGKVEKIQQPEKDELLFVVHSCGKNERLLISASPENCRIQLTEARPASPVDAPIFLMLLRKYLLNARINSICQPNSDRVVVVEFEALNELRDCTRFFLHCEIMGKHSNIILVDGNGRIVDAVRRVSPSMSSVRLILPKLEYSAPPAQDKLDPAKAAAEDFLNVLSDAPRPDKALSAAFFGLSPSIAALLFDRCAAEAKSRPVHSDAIETVSDCLAGFFTVTFLMREPCPALRCFRAADEFCCRSAHSGLNAASFRHSEQRRTNSIVPVPKTKALSGERRPLNESFPMLFSGLNARSKNSTLQYATKRNLRNFGISANC